MKREDIRLAIVVSRFNTDITTSMLQGAQQAAMEHGLSMDQLETFWVPGAFELSLAGKMLAKTRRYQAVICLGAVLKGETAHFEYVSMAAANGITHATLETEVPILFGVLTCNRAQAEARSRGERNKGTHSLKAALEMIDLIEKIHS